MKTLEEQLREKLEEIQSDFKNLKDDYDNLEYDMRNIEDNLFFLEEKLDLSGLVKIPEYTCSLPDVKDPNQLQLWR